MNQLTVRGFDKQLEQRIRQIAEQEHLSLNKTVLQLLRRGAGLVTSAPDPRAIGAGRDDFIGSWDKKDAQDFGAAIAGFEEIDAEQWP